MKRVKNVIISIIGQKKIEFLRSRPFLVNGQFRRIIKDIEYFKSSIESDFGVDVEVSKLLVRKYAHIIDKGLHRKDVEPGHSKIIAEELVKHLDLIKVKSESHLEDETFTWANQKLMIYNELQKNGVITELEGDSVEPKLSHDDFMVLIKSRRSNRQFLDKLVNEDILVKLAETVNWASSSCNKQPIKLFATNNPDLAKICLKQCKGGTGFSENIPCFVAFCVDMRGYYLPHEMYLPAIDVSLGAQNFFIATALHGLSATSLSWALKDEEEERRLKEILEIPDYFQIIFNAAVGYAQKEYIQPPRKPLKDTLKLVK